MQCSCYVEIEDIATMIAERINKARKEHKCHECGSVIKVGQKYFVEKEIYDGVFRTHKTCMPCLEVRNAYMHCWYWGKIWEDLRNCIEDISLPDFEKFSPEAQQKILELL